MKYVKLLKEHNYLWWWRGRGGGCQKSSFITTEKDILLNCVKFKKKRKKEIGQHLTIDPNWNHCLLPKLPIIGSPVKYWNFIWVIFLNEKISLAIFYFSCCQQISWKDQIQHCLSTLSDFLICGSQPQSHWFLLKMQIIICSCWFFLSSVS